MGVKIEFHNVLMTRIIFPPAMPLVSTINAVISIMHISDYDCHEIETLADGSVRLTIHLDD